MFPYSVERTPHVGKEREGGRVSYGTEGAAQRGGDLHRRLNSAPPDTPPTHTHADSVEGHLHANVNTTIPQHIHAHMHLQLTNEQRTLSITAALSQHLELQLLRIQQSLGSPLVISSRTHTVCAHIHTHKYFIYFPLITICPKSASHFRPIHTLTFILSLAPLDTDMKLHVCGIASHHPQ